MPLSSNRGKRSGCTDSEESYKLKNPEPVVWCDEGNRPMGVQKQKAGSKHVSGDEAGTGIRSRDCRINGLELRGLD